MVRRDPFQREVKAGLALTELTILALTAYGLDADKDEIDAD
jgi:hypothetical protein